MGLPSRGDCPFAAVSKPVASGGPVRFYEYESKQLLARHGVAAAEGLEAREVGGRGAPDRGRDRGARRC